MTDISPVIPSNCDIIIIKERFLNTDTFTGTQYKFILGKRVALFGKLWAIPIDTVTVRIDLFTPVDNLNGRMSLEAFKEATKEWKQERKSDVWTVVDHYYYKQQAGTAS